MSKRLITHIILHHSATPDGKTLSWDDIRRYHTSWRFQGNIILPDRAKELLKQGKKVEKPWVDVGYSLCIERIENSYETLIGRPWTMNGAHCYQHNRNRDSLGFCFVGCYDKEPPPPEMWNSSLKTCAWLCQLFNIPVQNVQGHREYANYKSCPGKAFDLSKFRRDLQESLK